HPHAPRRRLRHPPERMNPSRAPRPLVGAGLPRGAHVRPQHISIPATHPLRAHARLIVALLCAVISVTGVFAATVEGRVELPRTRATPVVNQRYAIVATAGVLSTNPPLAVVYLEGRFPKPATQPVTRITQ